VIVLLLVTTVATFASDETPNDNGPATLQPEICHVHCSKGGVVIRSFEFVQLFASRRSFLSVIYADGDHQHYAALYGLICEIVPIETPSAS
jgi:hypothetical protein